MSQPYVIIKQGLIKSRNEIASMSNIELESYIEDLCTEILENRDGIIYYRDTFFYVYNLCLCRRLDSYYTNNLEEAKKVIMYEKYSRIDEMEI